MRVFRTICFFLLFLFLIPSSYIFSEDHTPEPYSSDEFPNWVKDLSRLGIVTLGSIPFSLLLSTVSYDTYRFFSHDRDSAYAPLFFKSGNGVGYTEEEQRNLFFVSAGISLTAGLVDLGIQHFSRRKSHQEEMSKKKGLIELLPGGGIDTLPEDNPEKIKNDKDNNTEEKADSLNTDNFSKNDKVDKELLAYVLSTSGGVLLKSQNPKTRDIND